MAIFEDVVGVMLTTFVSWTVAVVGSALTVEMTVLAGGVTVLAGKVDTTVVGGTEMMVVGPVTVVPGKVDTTVVGGIEMVLADNVDKIVMADGKAVTVL